MGVATAGDAGAVGISNPPDPDAGGNMLLPGLIMNSDEGIPGCPAGSELENAGAGC